MLLGSARYAERATGVSRGHLLLMDLLGTDQYGTPFAAVLPECALASGSGARDGADGIDTGGITESEVSIPNVESNEFRYPILYLFRRQRMDSEGPGKFRGGSGLSMAIVPHDVPEVPDVMIHSHGVALPSAPGISGGHPGAFNRLKIKRNTNLSSLFERGIMPTDMSEIESETEETPPAFAHSRLGADDIFECDGGGGGGYGDPLERATGDVLSDIERGLISRAAAQARYGAIITGEPATVDQAPTDAERASIRAERQRSTKGPSARPSPDGGAPIGPVNEFLDIVRDGDGLVVRCRCGCTLGSSVEDYRNGLALREIEQPSDALASAATGETSSFAIREYFCPGCWTLIDTDVAPAETNASFG